MHRRLTELAALRGRSLGELVREACEVQYGVMGRQDQRAAVAALARLSLPVDSPQAMKRESAPPRT